MSEKRFFTKVALVTLTFEEVNTKYRILVLTKTTKDVQYENSGINRFRDNDRKQFGLPTDGRTDRRTDGPTDLLNDRLTAKQYAPSSLTGVGEETYYHGVYQ